MSVRPRFYLDHASTSWPKPPGSLEACVEYQTTNGASAGRGVYQTAERSSQLVSATRRLLAKVIGVADPNDIAICSNGTQALNAAILGLLQSSAMHGAHVVTTATEHNSVLRPLQLCSQSNRITWTAVNCDPTGYCAPDQIRDAMQDNTRMVIVNHVSNVTGAIQDARGVAAIAKERDAIFLLDAAQSLGYLPLNASADGFDIVAAPGHKGLGGMLGTGLLYVRKELQLQMQPVWIGGTGTQSDSVEGPFEWLYAVESGNSNLPGIASLKAGLEWLERNPTSDEQHLWASQLIESILRCNNLTLVGPLPNDTMRPRSYVVSLTSNTLSSHEMAMMLDSACGVEARSGFHCAGLIHSFLGTKQRGGTLRLSLGHTSTLADVEAAIAGIEMLGAM